ncbi:MAG: patatin-like protein [Kiritimatiellaeota bacterium]|nr:patatin-like protein [Kiritimatiellota bacterium]
MSEQSSMEGLQETRIALAFYGGVALAVYESGVAVECFRLVRGEGVYAQLRPLIGRTEVDIITGSSAGGLNGAFLANALVNRGDIMKLMEVWRHEGDVDRLLYRPKKDQPGSLLDGDYFLQKIYEALLEKRSAPAEEGALQSYVDLFITATNLDGDSVKIEPRKGRTIWTRTHRQLFHFAYREPGEGDDQGRNDFQSDEDLDLLAQAVRTTSSFPFAFEPVLVTKEGLGRRAQDLSGSAYHIDGGVLDNKPIEHAVQAIGARRADKQIKRLLFYVEPDPEPVSARSASVVARSYTPWEVVLKALVSLPGYQSITSALRKIQENNSRAESYQRTMNYYDTAAAQYRAKQGQHDPAHDTWTSDKHRRIVYLPDEDRASSLYRAMEDGYLDMRLEREVGAKSDHGEELRHQLAELKRHCTELREKLAGTERHEFRSWAKELYLVQRALLDSLDLSYHQRMYRYLAQIVRDLYPPSLIGTGDGAGTEMARRAAVIGMLNEMKDHFYSQEDLLRSRQTTEAAVQDTELLELSALLDSTLARLKNIASQHYEQTQAIMEALLKQVQHREFLKRRTDFVEQLRETSWRKLQNAYLALPADVQSWSSPACKGREAQPVCQCYWKLRDALDSFFQRDLILYPMLQNQEVTNALHRVDFARISPADANEFMGGPSPAEKLAGEKCFHFGGFMSETWRGNDLTWGRLDAAEILITQLLPDQVTEADRKQIIKQAHDEIIAEMRSRGMGIFLPDASQDRAHLIGNQGLGDIPKPKKTDWVLRAMLVVVKMLKQTLEESRLAPWYKRLLSCLTWTCIALPLLWRSRLARGLALAAVVVGLLLYLCHRYHVWPWPGP